MTVVLNDNNELIPYRTVTGWRVCIDYRKLNDATRKDHFPLPFIDQMLERLSGNEYYCFLDGFSGFFQIPIAPEYQEKTTFTCPYGTFTYRRMPFGLCNAPATFQRCMTAIFHDMVEYFMEVFMDDFSVFGNSFEQCLNNLDKMLGRCEETNLVLNWGKCHFMVKEGIVLGHKISGKGIEVDKAKIDVIAKLPYPSNVKGVRSFLGHAGFYRSDFAVGTVLGQRIDGKFKPIYYVSKTLNDAQAHYTTTEKELLAIVFSFDKFRPYLILSKTIVYTYHSALKYLFSKQDAKPRLIGWILLLQGFNIKIKDKKGAKNLGADHLSRLKNPNMGELVEDEITDKFRDEHLMILKAKLNDEEPWYAYYINYIVRKFVPPKWTPKRRKRFFSQVRNYFWDEPFAFRLCPDNVMRRCMAGNEILKILAHCHFGPTRGHHSASVTGRKVYEVCEVFDVWGLDFMGLFPDSRGNKYILVAVDYVSKWVKAQALPINDARVVVRFLKELFARFGVPKALINDRGTHFCNSQLEKALLKYENRLQNSNRMHPFRLVYGKACHLPVEIEHKAYWALKQCNIDLTATAKNHFMELNELMELRDGAYENTRIYKERTKRWHDSSLRRDKNFINGDKVLLFNSRLKLHPGKLKSK
ncbi:reverse transcriptase domain-containing protein [Tanacetum coccineum]|uniref:Reverse transcriptase domain-containing protein n=1 Tax=Tanacetum coccineum TaxID=301880 RepID=A0ABQ4YUA1_9ASTR